MTTCRPPTWSVATSNRWWHRLVRPGPLTRAVRQGAICYLDEVVEARKDPTVVLHPAGRRPPRAAH